MWCQTQANERAKDDKKNTISEAHASKALEELGFGHYLLTAPACSEGGAGASAAGGAGAQSGAVAAHEPGGRKKGKRKRAAVEFTEEDLRRQQELFASAKQSTAE